MAFWPGLIVIGATTAMMAVSVFYVGGKLRRLGVSPVFVNSMTLFCLFFYFMFVWCWIYTASCDPGRIQDDLAARGLLEPVSRGDVPPCLRSLPICRHCMMPKPRGSAHCKTCEHCVLRYDHHCGVIGACIADRNLKSFILTFLYMVGFCFVSAILGICAFAKDEKSKRDSNILELVLAVYALAVGVSMLLFGGATFLQGMSVGEIKKIDGSMRSLRLQKYLTAFGDTWFERLIPIQRHATFLAWPGVSWDTDVEVP